MNIQAKDNYKTLINSSKQFIKYLETLGEEKLDSNTSLNALKVGYATFSLLLWKDEYIKKDKEKNLSTTLVDNLLEVYLTNIAIKNKEGKWQIGDYIFDSNLDVVDKVRNKLAHGDFIIQGDNVILNYNPEVTIPITNLVSFSVHLGNDWEKMKQYGENTNSVFRNYNILNEFSIKTKEDLDEAINNISYIEIKDRPKPARRRTLEYLQMVFFLKDKVIKEIERNHQVENITEQETAKKLLDTIGIDVTIKEVPTRYLENIDKVKGMYLSKLSELKLMGPYYQQKYLTHWLHELVAEKISKKNINYGLLSNQVYLKGLEDNKDKDVVSLVEDSKYGETLTIMNEKAIISSYIANFYFTYIYGLDNILNTSNQEYLPNIIRGKAFDFSKLDLSNINPDSIIIHEYPEFQEQINKLRQDLENLNYKHLRVLENINRVRPIKGKEKFVEDMEVLLKTIEEEQERIKILLSKCELFMKNHYEEYKRNRSIINHIRNSIAHGNIGVDIFRGNYTTNDAVINFIDKDEADTVFELELTAEDFNSISNDNNINEILKFLGDEEENNYERGALCH